MSRNKKAKYESESEDSEEEDRIDAEEIQIDFEAKTIMDDDAQGIHRLLQQLFLKAPIDLSDITNHIVQQSNIGSVIKACQDDELDEVFGITTALIAKEQKFVNQLYKYLYLKCESNGSEVLKKLQQLLMDPSHTICLLIHERFLNIPMEIGPPLLNCLIQELSSLKEGKHPTHFLVITHSHLFPEPLPFKKGKKVKKKAKSTELEFDFSEMEYFKKESILQFSYSVADVRDTVVGGKWEEDDDCMTPYRSVLILTSNAFHQVISQLLTEELRT